ncbi:hypothetical protein K435DRAFT_682351 [Dendrothele bispora CBS 962.96]|uniref:Tc1-like transposase DDE domain-containing protein n=1 Tax=Dendrothele bispora (strain CBS 962.96) TaxID=1314807 RepID=A0A4S8LDQ4_DENBC|nr:hypothetical protein K435DRAFT_682351 [Dendrothele bispora CBS 962.96]
MGNRKISSDLKEAALRMWDHGWELSDICAALVVSPRSMYRWRSLFEELGSVNRPPSVLRGRPRIIGMLSLQACRDIYARNSDTYLSELQWYLAIEHDIAISISALQANLEKAVDLTRKVLHKIAIERDEQRRTDFRNGITDPHYFTGNVFVRGTRYSLAAAMSTKGYIATRVVEGSYNAPEFFSFIVDEVVPHMNAYPGDQSVLVMDNCRIHHNETLQETLNAQRTCLYIIQ